jgi:hypothetical protein
MRDIISIIMASAFSLMICNAASAGCLFDESSQKSIELGTGEFKLWKPKIKIGLVSISPGPEGSLTVSSTYAGLDKTISGDTTRGLNFTLTDSKTCAGTIVIISCFSGYYMKPHQLVCQQEEF